MGTNNDRDLPAAGGTGAGPKPRLPVRASIYIDVDGTVHFGALFEELVPVADALGSRKNPPDDDFALEAGVGSGA